jgi:4-aminobutyrate aminotransferase-like enzyme
VSENSSLPPQLNTTVPGPRSLALAGRLAAVESRNVTCLGPAPPIFWQKASGANVWDADGNRYLDLTAAFGVAAAGHSHPDVVDAIAQQAGQLLHGMGDVHPAEVKVELLEALVARFPGRRPARGILLSSGSDAIEAALKTAMLATGTPGVIAFEGAYHGLSIGSLDATWRPDFRQPFEKRLPRTTRFARFGDLDSVRSTAQEEGAAIGAVLVEPVQGRAGEQIPPPGFLAALRALCDEQGWLFIADEIYTGFGRTGRFFACEHDNVGPDLLCVGKGLSGGMPISACLGLEDVMNAWPSSTGEALHTQTYLGHPASCAAALASLRAIEREKLVERAAENGAVALQYLRTRLSTRSEVREVRGLGMMIGVECASGDLAARACRTALERGVILLPSGENGRVLSITPPLNIDRDALLLALDIVCGALA